jgi:hypothetical protein
VVRQAVDQYGQEYDPATDWYKPLRDCIRRINEDHLPVQGLYEILALVDRQKHDSYVQCIEGYKSFHGIRKPIKWIGRPMLALADVAGLPVRVNPEMMIEKNGQKYLVKLYFKEERLHKKHAELIVSLMERAFPWALESEILCSVLDVRTGRLLNPHPTKNVDKLLEAEAVAFQQLWTSLSA